MAERTGLEPATPCVTGRYSKPTELPLLIGLLGKHWCIELLDLTQGALYLAERTGLEPATPCVTGRYSKPTELPLRIRCFQLTK